MEKASNVLPIPWPPLTVRFKRALAAEEIDAMKSRGAAIIATKKAEDTAYSFSGESVDVDLLSFLYRHSKKVVSTNPTPVGSINIKAYEELFRALGIVTWFLKTQTYPAFQNEIPDDAFDGGYFDTIEGFVNAKRKGLFGDRFSKRARTEVPNDEDEEMSDAGATLDIMGISSFTMGDEESSIPKAKPSPQPENIFGGYQAVPTLPGLLFPYFPGMLENDMNYVSTVIKEYFLECLGDTREEILAVYRDLKGGMGSVASTETGKILQHLYMGVSLAIRGQARLFPIMDKRRYLGFTLHGWYFTVSIDGYKHRPIAQEELAKCVLQVDEHAVAIAEILKKLASMKMIDGKKPTKKFLLDHKEEILKSPRALADLIRGFRIDEPDTVEELEKIAARLAYIQKYWTFTVENVLKAVDLLLAKSFPTPDAPMFTRGGTITATDSAISIFALFGDVGFSFRTPGGRPMKIPKDISADTVLKPYKGKGAKEITPNPTFILSKKSLGLCVEDWKAFMADHAFLNKPSRDAAFRCVAFGGPPGKKFWNGLIERVGPLVSETSHTFVADRLENEGSVISDDEGDIGDFL